MGPVQIVATVLAAALTLVAVALAVRAVYRMVAVVRLGQPDPDRFTRKLARTQAMLTETVGHTRMLKWSVVGAAHWFVMVAFITLTLLVLEAYFDVVDPIAELPLLGGWLPYGLLAELIGALGLLGIGVLVVIRLLNRPNRAPRAVALCRVDHVAGLFRRVRHRGRPDLWLPHPRPQGGRRPLRLPRLGHADQPRPRRRPASE